MSFIIDEMDEFSIVGFIKKIPLGQGNIMCPLFWNELNENYFSKLDDNSEISKYIKEHNIGEFAVCIDEMEKDHFKYLVGGLYKGEKVPEGMEIYTFKKSKWAKFKCNGPLPIALQMLNAYIFDIWFKNMDCYELSQNANIEWYSNGDITSKDYESGIWLPIKRK